MSNRVTSSTAPAPQGTMGQGNTSQAMGQGNSAHGNMAQGNMASSPSHEKIAMRAYDKWCKRGCPQGSHMQDWTEAENELRSEMSRASQASQTRR